MKKIIANKYFLYSLMLLSGLFLGWLLFHSPHRHEKQEMVSQEGQEEIWTCAMHPQIRMHAPGKCPICGMDLIPLVHSEAAADSDAVHLTESAAQLANVMTTVVSRSNATKVIRLYGKVAADERLVQSQVSHVAGRIDRLMVNYTGEMIQKGQPLAEIYSPELVTAQQELLEAAAMKGTQPELYQAAKERLLQWKLTEAQIDGIERSGAIKNEIDVVSGSSGVVTARNVNIGDYVKEGTVLYEVADLSKVWVLFDVYESDLALIRRGDKIEFTLNAIPGKTFSGTAAFIDPVIDPGSRVARVRVEVNNGSGILKPDMFATGMVQADLSGFRDKIVIPRSAVLWTGKRSIVYVKLKEEGDLAFRMREVELGPRVGNDYVIESGLMEGEEIVTEGTFSVDAAAQLEGKPSMMNREKATVSPMPGMDMH